MGVIDRCPGFQPSYYSSFGKGGGEAGGFFFKQKSRMLTHKGPRFKNLTILPASERSNLHSSKRSQNATCHRATIAASQMAQLRGGKNGTQEVIRSTPHPLLPGLGNQFGMGDKIRNICIEYYSIRYFSEIFAKIVATLNVTLIQINRRHEVEDDLFPPR